MLLTPKGQRAVDEKPTRKCYWDMLLRYDHVLRKAHLNIKRVEGGLMFLMYLEQDISEKKVLHGQLCLLNEEFEAFKTLLSLPLEQAESQDNAE